MRRKQHASKEVRALTNPISSISESRLINYMDLIYPEILATLHLAFSDSPATPKTHGLYLECSLNDSSDGTDLRHMFRLFHAELIKVDTLLQHINSFKGVVPGESLVATLDVIHNVPQTAFAPPHYERAVVALVGFSPCCMNAVFMSFAVDPKRADPVPGGGWQTDLHRMLLGPQPTSYEHVLELRVLREDRLEADHHAFLPREIMSFNALPRDRKISGFPISWTFNIESQAEKSCLCLYPLPNKDSPPFPPVSLRLRDSVKDLADLARAVADVLIEHFTSRKSGKIPWLEIQFENKRAPWGWKSADPALARRLSIELKERGIREELANVGIASQTELDFMEAVVRKGLTRPGLI
ncbi:hypothetical protein P7C70_g4354, partial [Phenoliferia sp. Uapishka_3]